MNTESEYNRAAEKGTVALPAMWVCDSSYLTTKALQAWLIVAELRLRRPQRLAYALLAPRRHKLGGVADCASHADSSSCRREGRCQQKMGGNRCSAVAERHKVLPVGKVTGNSTAGAARDETAPGGVARHQMSIRLLLRRDGDAGKRAAPSG